MPKKTRQIGAGTLSAGNPAPPSSNTVMKEEDVAGSQTLGEIELRGMPSSAENFTSDTDDAFVFDNPMRESQQPRQQPSASLSPAARPASDIAFHPFFERAALLSQFIISLVSFGSALAYNKPNSPLLPVSFKDGEAKLLIVLIGNTLHLFTITIAPFVVLNNPQRPWGIVQSMSCLLVAANRLPHFFIGRSFLLNCATVTEIIGYGILSKFGNDQAKLFAALSDAKLRHFVFSVLPYSIVPTLLSIAFLQAESMSCFFENWNESGLSIAVCTDKSHSTNVFSAVFVTVSTIRIFVLPFIDYTLDNVIRMEFEVA